MSSSATQTFPPPTLTLIPPPTPVIPIEEHCLGSGIYHWLNQFVNIFAALFLSSIGMLINVHFLWTHVDILIASVVLVIVVKSTVAATITKAFGYNIRTSVVVS